jgi:hypothetical protein
MDSSPIDSPDEAACYAKLAGLLHPGGLAGPHRGERHRLGIHRRRRDPVLDHRGGACGRVFNARTATVSEGTHRRPSQIPMILHGIARGTPTAQMARELGGDRRHLLRLRHRLREHARRWPDRDPPGDAVVEADEMSRDAGGKRDPAPRPGGPAAAAGESPARPRPLRRRPAADRRGRRPGLGLAAVGGARPRQR